MTVTYELPNYRVLGTDISASTTNNNTNTNDNDNNENNENNDNNDNNDNNYNSDTNYNNDNEDNIENNDNNDNNDNSDPNYNNDNDDNNDNNNNNNNNTGVNIYGGALDSATYLRSSNSSARAIMSLSYLLRREANSTCTRPSWARRFELVSASSSRRPFKPSKSVCSDVSWM